MKRLFLVAICAGLAGCATTPSLNNLTDKNYSLKTFSPRSGNGVSEDDCPVGAHSWRHDGLAQLLNEGNACEQFNKNARLEQIGDVLAQRFSTKPWGAFYLSLAAYDRHDYPRSLWMISLALEKAPSFGMLHYQKGRVFLAMKDLASANGEFRTAVNDEPDLTEARMYLARVDIREQKYSDAADELQKVVVLEPGSATTWANLGETDIVLQKTNRAVDAYEHAVNSDPQSIGYRLRLASLYEQVKNYPAALSAYQRAADLARSSRIPAEDHDIDINAKISALEKITQVADTAKSKAQSGGQQ